MASFSFRPLAHRMTSIGTRLAPLWRRYRALPFWLQAVIAVVTIIAVLALGSFLAGLGKKNPEQTLATVTLTSIGELSGGGVSVGGIGSVRSITEAAILAESGGVVKSVRTSVGASVPAGFVLAELDNASQRAAVLQAEGAYDAAIAARAGASPGDIAASALNTYTSSYASLDTILRTYVDTFYGTTGAQGPQFLIAPAPFDLSYFPMKRAQLTQAMNAWRARLASASSKDAPALLAEAEAITRQANALTNDIATVATRNGTDANASQLAALATARSSIASLQATLTAAKQANQSQGTSATAGVDASVKSALGTLRAAQANLEKTLVRAPLSGQVNFLPIRVGDYVTPLSHVATVAQNGALEIVTYVSEDTRAHLAVGMKVTVEEKYGGVITSIAPALDPVTKQIEVKIAVNSGTPLVNGQSVHIAFPFTPPAQAASQSAGPILLPLTTLKLTPSARVVFTVGAEGRLSAHPVDIGNVRGDRIEILTPLPSDMRIVADARGLADGQKVNVSE
jgi:multidrug efflux pump subunit AcrA (membrane-fusion protein)